MPLLCDAQLYFALQNCAVPLLCSDGALLRSAAALLNIASPSLSCALPWLCVAVLCRAQLSLGSAVPDAAKPLPCYAGRS
jgi:hypothetical protein